MNKSNSKRVITHAIKKYGRMPETFLGIFLAVSLSVGAWEMLSSTTVEANTQKIQDSAEARLLAAVSSTQNDAPLIEMVSVVQSTPEPTLTPSPTETPTPTPSPTASPTATPVPPTPTPSPTPSPTPKPKPAAAFRPAQASVQVDQLIKQQADKYNLPRWFYYAIAERESSFRPNLVSPEGTDFGLTQLSGQWYTGKPYPQHLNSPDDWHTQYSYDMNFKKFGTWIQMSQVTPLYDALDAKQNLDRFSTGYAVPAFIALKRAYGLSDTETLRAVAFHWNKGMIVSYNPKNTDYLALYDQYVRQYKSKVETEDGVWDGKPSLGQY